MQRCSFLLSAIEAHARFQPEKIAIESAYGIITYAQLWHNIIEAGQKLMQIQGLVALHVDRTPSLITLMLACWYTGNPYLALDKNHPTERKKSLMAMAKPAVCIVDDESMELSWLGDVKTMPLSNLQPLKISTSSLPPDLAYLLFTSGSTGTPKGVMIAEKGIHQLLNWARSYYSPSVLRSVLASTTTTFDLSVFEIFVPLYCGTKIYLVENILSLIEADMDFDISLINTVPSAIREVLRVNKIPPSCHTINLAGEVLTSDLVKALYQKPHIQAIYNLWGPSEDTTYSTVYHCRKDMPIPQQVPIGIPIPGTTITLLNPEEKENGVQVGEIGLSGHGLSLGYLNQPELTAKAFIDNPSPPNQKTYRTGDLGYWDDEHQLHFCGRIDFQVKIRGYRIELEEIESCLYLHPEVIECVIIVIHKHNLPQLVAIIRANSNNLTQDAIQRHLAKTLPTYMIPSHCIMQTHPLPRTPNGKLCRRQALTIAEMHIKKDDASQSISTSPTFEDICKQVLGCPIHLDKSFVDLGGDSLQAVHLLHQLEQFNIGKTTLKTILNKKISLTKLEQQLEHCSTMQKSSNRMPIEKTMWQLYQQHQQAYHVSVAIDIKGKFDQARLIEAIETVVYNEASFHRQYCVQDNMEGNFTFTYKQIPIKVLVVPFSNSEHELPSLMQQLSSSFINKPFDLTNPGHIRIILITNGMDKARLLITMPHISIDGYGLQSLFEKISYYYSSKELISTLENSQQALTPPHRIASSNLLSTQQYWTQQLSQKAEFITPSQISQEKALFLKNKIDSDAYNHIKSIAQQLEITPASLLLGLFQCLLHKLDLGKQIFVAVPFANRFTPELRKVCCLTKSLPVYSHFQEEKKLSDYLAGQHQQLLDTLEHHTIDIEAVLKAMPNPPRCFDIIFSFMDFAQSAFQLPDAICKLKFIPQNRNKAPLVLSLIPETDGHLTIWLESNQTYFTKPMLESLSQCYETLISSISDQLNTPLSKLNIVPAKQLATINQHKQFQSYQGHRQLTEKLFQIAKTYPDNIALQCPEKKLTYKELFDISRNIAQQLANRNISPGSAIGISVNKNWRCVAAILGVLLNGCHYVPIDKRNPFERTNHILKDANIDWLIHDDNPSEAASNHLFIDTLIESATGIFTIKNNPRNLAYIIYTSGTTGKPKGVPITHKNVLSLFDSCTDWLDFRSDDVWTLFHSYAFDFSVWEIFGALLTGSKLLIVDEPTTASPQRFAKLLEAEQVTMLSQTPTALRNLLNTQNNINFSPRFVFFGGEALTQDIIKLWQQKQSETTRLINLYGITEITVHATVAEIDFNQPTIDIGKPLSDMGLQIRGMHNQPLPLNFPGELIISGEGLSKGYWNNPELTAKKFINIDATPCYCSGDLALLDNSGKFHYCGRIDKQFKLNGHRLEKNEIIGALLAHPQIEQAELKVIHSETGIQFLVAYYLAKYELDRESLHHFLASQLPSFALPSHCIHLSAFPLTINGKIDVSSLPNPKQEVIASSQQELTNIQQKVCECWQSVLRIKIAKSQYQASFFDLGGNSVKAIQLTQIINSHFSIISFSVIDVFRYTTLEQQINEIELRHQKSPISKEECYA
ncbi:amino acid adenylation domain-containing protein [Legionella israelensis]|uniref:non-ribosomal peptide synthetase n=1 Tax=Legionella israelensis TaxID=454 RepID=UPI00117CCA12|nr:non-ribosomal peptide synthetase [Legionella israelensis]QDP73283.1 amino acid adenylation domain-containing protein [Legionella israelensis]